MQLLRELTGGIVYNMILDEIDENYLWDEIKFWRSKEFLIFCTNFSNDNFITRT